MTLDSLTMAADPGRSFEDMLLQLGGWVLAAASKQTFWAALQDVRLREQCFSREKVLFVHTCIPCMSSAFVLISNRPQLRF